MAETPRRRLTFEGNRRQQYQRILPLGNTCIDYGVDCGWLTVGPSQVHAYSLRMYFQPSGAHLLANVFVVELIRTDGGLCIVEYCIEPEPSPVVD